MYRGSLARIDTERLLLMKNHAYACHGGDSEWLRHGMASEEYGYSVDGYLPEIPIADIKTELAGREHVPNKNERREDRRRASKHGSRRTRGAR